MRVRKSLLIGIVACLLARPCSPMTAIGIPAQEITQLLNHAQLMMQIAKQAQQIEIALRQYEQLYQQGRMLTNMQWGDVGSSLAQLAGVIRQGQGLAYTMSNLDLVFKQAYPGYLQNGVGFNAQYGKWNQVNMDTISGVLKALNVAQAQLSSDQAIVRIIRNFSSSAVGQNQILQAGTMMADQQVQQLEKLRQIMMLQVQSEAVYQGRSINAESVQQGVRRSAFAPARFVPVN